MTAEKKLKDEQELREKIKEALRKKNSAEDEEKEKIEFLLKRL